MFCVSVHVSLKVLLKGSAEVKSSSMLVVQERGESLSGRPHSAPPNLCSLGSLTFSEIEKVRVTSCGCSNTWTSPHYHGHSPGCMDLQTVPSLAVSYCSHTGWAGSEQYKYYIKPYFMHVFVLEWMCVCCYFFCINSSAFVLICSSKGDTLSVLSVLTEVWVNGHTVPGNNIAVNTHKKYINIYRNKDEKNKHLFWEQMRLPVGDVNVLQFMLVYCVFLDEHVNHEPQFLLYFNKHE